MSFAIVLTIVYLLVLIKLISEAIKQEKVTVGDLVWILGLTAIAPISIIGIIVFEFERGIGKKVIWEKSK